MLVHQRVNLSYLVANPEGPSCNYQTSREMKRFFTALHDHISWPWLLPVRFKKPNWLVISNRILLSTKNQWSFSIPKLQAPALRQDDKLMFDPLSFNDFPAIMASPTKEVPNKKPHRIGEKLGWKVEAGDKKPIKQIQAVHGRRIAIHIYILYIYIHIHTHIHTHTYIYIYDINTHIYIYI